MPKKKSVKTKTKSKSKNLVLYVEDSTMKAKTFKNLKGAQAFINVFRMQSPPPMDGYWVELLITDIAGEVHSLDSIEID